MPGFEWFSGQETLRIEPWGPDAIRVRGRVGPVLGELPGALLEGAPALSEAKVEVSGSTARIVNGRVTVELTTEVEDHGQGMLRFTNTATGEELLAEQPIHFWWPGPRL